MTAASPDRGRCLPTSHAPVALCPAAPAISYRFSTPPTGVCYEVPVIPRPAVHARDPLNAGSQQGHGGQERNLVSLAICQGNLNFKLAQRTQSEAQALVVRNQPFSKSALRRKRRLRAAMALNLKTTHQPNVQCEVTTGASPSETRIGSVCGDGTVETFQLEGVACGLLEDLRTGGQVGQSAILRFRQLAFADKHSSRAAQLTLSLSATKDAADLASGLYGHVRAAVQSMYANYVLQRIVETLPSSGSKFIAMELLGNGGGVARHRFGCRILCRLLEHGSPNEPALSDLFDEVLREAETLCCHCFGSFVMAHFLEFGQQAHRQIVSRALRLNTLVNSADKKGSRLVEAALQLASPLDKHAIASDLLKHAEHVIWLANSRYGCHVVQSLLRMSEYHERAAAILEPAEEVLRLTKSGRHVLAVLDSST